MTSLKEKQVDKMLDKMFGDGDDALRIITKLALTNTEITPEVLATLHYLKKQNEEDAKGLEEELNMTLDASGNVIPVEPQVALLENKITFTIENSVVHNLNGVIDCGGNLVQDAPPYRLPVGKT